MASSLPDRTASKSPSSDIVSSIQGNNVQNADVGKAPESASLSRSISVTYPSRKSSNKQTKGQLAECRVSTTSSSSTVRVPKTPPRSPISLASRVPQAVSPTQGKSNPTSPYRMTRSRSAAELQTHMGLESPPRAVAPKEISSPDCKSPVGINQFLSRLNAVSIDSTNV